MKELAAAILQFLQYQQKVEAQRAQQFEAMMQRLAELIAAERETEAIRDESGRVVGSRSRIRMMQ